MRISLLLQREPLGRIVEQTLTRFWQAQYGQPYEVRWDQGWPDGRSRTGGRQTWWCNAYLNAIFTPEAEAVIFDPIRREFSYSLSRWRRPVQKSYVSLALSRAGAPWLARASLRVNPAVPGAAYQLIVAGNHKLRLLDYQSQSAYSILKHGFKPDFMQQELSIRQEAACLGLPIPPLQAVAPDGSWYREAYMSGTPLNRLADPAAAEQAKIRAVLALTRLLTATTQEEPAAAYLDRLEAQLCTLLADNRLLSAGQKEALRRQVERLSGQIRALQAGVGRALLTALGHGDFQSGNILVNPAGVWLIDWEYAARRQVSYDTLVFTLRSRFPAGLAARLRGFVADGLAEPGARWPIADWPEPPQRAFYAALFLLEELHLHLAENDNPLFTRPGAGLLALSHELALFPGLTV